MLENTMKPRRKNVTPDELREMAALYPDNDNMAIAEQFGLSVWSIKSLAYKHGWHKSPKFISRIQSKKAIQNNNAARLNTDSAIRKRTETSIRLNHIEKARLHNGLPQKTKRHYRLEPRTKLMQRAYLKRRGYIIDEPSLTAFYDENTQRSPRIEKVPRGKKIGTIKSWYDFAPKKEEKG